MHSILLYRSIMSTIEMRWKFIITPFKTLPCFTTDSKLRLNIFVLFSGEVWSMVFTTGVRSVLITKWNYNLKFGGNG